MAFTQSRMVEAEFLAEAEDASAAPAVDDDPPRSPFPWRRDLLDTIAGGAERPESAYDVLPAIAAPATAEQMAELCGAFEGWVHRALEERRRDSHLRGWCDALHRAAALAEAAHPLQAERLRTYHGLIARSVLLADALPAREVLRQAHVKPILVWVCKEDGDIARDDIRTRFNLGEANTTRILSLMTASGLLERELGGRQAFFRPSRLGRELVGSAQPQRASRAATERAGDRAAKVVPVRALDAAHQKYQRSYRVADHGHAQAAT